MARSAGRTDGRADEHYMASERRKIHNQNGMESVRAYVPSSRETFLKIKKKVNQLEHDHTHKCNRSVSIPPLARRVGWKRGWKEPVGPNRMPNAASRPGVPLETSPVQSSSASSKRRLWTPPSTNRSAWHFGIGRGGRTTTELEEFHYQQRRPSRGFFPPRAR